MSKPEIKNTILTIGHSTHTIDGFLLMLRSFQIECLVDIRSYPGSRRYPHFNKESLEIFLPANDIEYIHLKELGGRRKAKKDSVNNAWRNEAFRGYADYMESSSFEESIKRLTEIASQKRVAYMCSEALWWRCHRSLVSDYLKHLGWTVIHIMGEGKSEEHPYTSPARISEGKLVYIQRNSLFKR